MFKTEQAKKVFFKGSRLLRHNKAFMLQLGIISAAAIGVADTAFAQTANVATNQISVLSTPMQNFRDFMSSDVANFASVAGVGIGAASWAMSDNNQVVKTGMRVVGASAVMLQAPNFIQQMTGIVF